MPSAIDDLVSAALLLLVFTRGLPMLGLGAGSLRAPPRPRMAQAWALLPGAIGIHVLLQTNLLDHLAHASWPALVFWLLYFPAAVGYAIARCLLMKTGSKTPEVSNVVR